MPVDKPCRFAFVLPIIVSIWLPITIILIYVISVLKGDVPAIFPYVSDTGAWPPQSCIFGTTLNLNSLLMGTIFYIRFREVEEVCKIKENTDDISLWNKLSLALALLGLFGLCLLGNFQITNAVLIHVFGALLAFSMGVVYDCFQAYISLKIFPEVGDKRINVLRILCAVTSVVTFLTCVITGVMSFQDFTGSDLTKWTKNDGGFSLHLISTISEWILVLINILYILSFTCEFRRVSISLPVVEISK